LKLLLRSQPRISPAILRSIGSTDEIWAARPPYELRDVTLDELLAGFDPSLYEGSNIRPLPGPPEQFQATQADIGVIGGSAGGSKSIALLFEPLRHKDNPRFGGVIFRESFPQIFNEGSLWDTSMEFYLKTGAEPRSSPPPSWTWPSKARVTFHHLADLQQALKDWQGAQPVYQGWDELTQFIERAFFNIALSRARSTSGIKPYVRGSCNPDPKSWVKKFLAPWIVRGWTQGEFGPARSGEIRHFIRLDGDIKWVKADYQDRQGSKATSVTFIRSTVFDNKMLLYKDPGYLSKLKSLPLVDQERLLWGNWEISEQGNMFRKDWFVLVSLDSIPHGLKLIRFWDLAASEKKPSHKKQPDFTASALMGWDSYNDIYYFIDMTLMQETPYTVEKAILRTARSDAILASRMEAASYGIRMEQEPGASGITVTEHYKRNVLQNYDFEGIKSTGSKIERAKPLSAETQRGKVYMVEGVWNDDFFMYAGAFPTEGVKDDPVDAASGAFNAINAPIEMPCPIDPSDRFASFGMWQKSPLI
jgi:predicted phage terminase large subunit-like protein